MKNNKFPCFLNRIGSVWYRHMRVYVSHLVANGLPPFLEPMIFLAGIGLGLGRVIGTMDNLPYIQFLATGLLVTSAMFTAAFECTFETFVRLEFDKVYDGMLGAPLSAEDLIIGEILWAGSKGAFFSFAVMLMMLLFGVLQLSFLQLLVPIVGFLTGLMFGALSIFVTSFVKNINYFNFYITGLLSPLFFFSGVVFPVKNLPVLLQKVSFALPLTHAVRLARAFAVKRLDTDLVWSLVYILIFIPLVTMLSLKSLRHRLID